MPSVAFSRRTLLRFAPLPFLASCEAASGAEAREGKAKSLILLYMTGGPAQQETFDPKPDAPTGTRGEFKPADTNVPGVQICEHLPLLAKQAHRYAIIRSTWHGSDTHGVGVHYNLTGLKHAPRSGGEPQVDRRDPPCIGSVIRHLRGDRNGLPAAVQLPRQVGDQNNAYWGGQHAGFLGPKYDPLFLHDEAWLPGDPLPGLAPNADVKPPRQQDRAELLSALQANRATNGSDDFARFQQQALDMMRSSAAWKAFRFDDEKPGTLARYGDNRFGRSCLVARRLVEAGVGCVTVPWTFKQSEQNFDTHSKHFPKMKDKLLPVIDRAFAALLDDLADRGLLGSTLVSWTGEFGRTPKVNGSGGRDHWGRVYSTVLAGGGVKGGQVIGKSTKDGGLPADEAVHVSDFFASMYHALGYTSASAVKDATGRPHHFVTGRPVAKLFE
ncbi:MAG: DUF1501 domain-containing protein [Planctomycetes bacterium]|nr:DUF1501 domain-containing protein [Planctomycetota bacterium]